MMGLSVDRIIKAAFKEGRTALLEHEAKQICKKYRINTPRFHLARDATEAVEATRRLGFPVVLKVVSPDILHKSDAGCVIIGLRSAREVRHAFRKIVDNAEGYDPQARFKGVLVEKMQPPGIEVIVGGFRDSQFGQVLMFGLGGVFVQVFEDVSFRVAPLTERSARRMIREIKGYAILKGFRGHGAADEQGLLKVLLASSKLMTDCPRISEMDLNPVLVYEDGVVAVDARITLAS